MANSKNKDTMTIVHSIIGVAIMVLFRYLPLNLPEIRHFPWNLVSVDICRSTLEQFVCDCDGRFF